MFSFLSGKSSRKGATLMASVTSVSGVVLLVSATSLMYIQGWNDIVDDRRDGGQARLNAKSGLQKTIAEVESGEIDIKSLVENASLEIADLAITDLNCSQMSYDSHIAAEIWSSSQAGDFDVKIKAMNLGSRVGDRVLPWLRVDAVGREGDRTRYLSSVLRPVSNDASEGGLDDYVDNTTLTLYHEETIIEVTLTEIIESVMYHAGGGQDDGDDHGDDDHGDCGDHSGSNNGHGNNEDGVDSSNPGKGHGGPNGKDDASGDYDDEGGSDHGDNDDHCRVDQVSDFCGGDHGDDCDDHGDDDHGDDDHGDDDHGDDDHGECEEEDEVEVNHPVPDYRYSRVVINNVVTNTRVIDLEFVICHRESVTTTSSSTTTTTTTTTTPVDSDEGGSDHGDDDHGDDDHGDDDHGDDDHGDSSSGNNGHGNNEDGVDSSNPGQGGGGPNGSQDPSGNDDDEGSQGGDHGDDDKGKDDDKDKGKDDDKDKGKDDDKDKGKDKGKGKKALLILPHPQYCDASPLHCAAPCSNGKGKGQEDCDDDDHGNSDDDHGESGDCDDDHGDDDHGDDDHGDDDHGDDDHGDDDHGDDEGEEESEDGTLVTVTILELYQHLTHTADYAAGCSDGESEDSYNYVRVGRSFDPMVYVPCPKSAE